MITPELLETSSQNMQGMVERADKFKYGYTEVHGLRFNVSDVLVKCCYVKLMEMT